MAVVGRNDQAQAALLVKGTEEILDLGRGRGIEIAGRLIGGESACGSRIRERAMATRCCSPPDNSPGRCVKPLRETHGLQQLARRTPVALGPVPSRAIRAGIITFSSAVKSGSR